MSDGYNYLFLQVDLQGYHNQEDRFGAQLAAYTRKQFFEGLLLFGRNNRMACNDAWSTVMFYHWNPCGTLLMLTRLCMC